MKILSLNLERLKIEDKEKLIFIKNLVESENVDLIFVTETNLILDFGKEYYNFHSKELPNLHDGQEYKKR